MSKAPSSQVSGAVPSPRPPAKKARTASSQACPPRNGKVCSLCVTCRECRQNPQAICDLCRRCRVCRGPGATHECRDKAQLLC
jgi:hypothetical protein